jgi:hypothetical protein
MRSFIVFTCVALAALSTIVPTSLLVAQEMDDTIEVAEPLTYTRIYADSAGASHFADVQIDMSLADYAPPAPPISVSDMIPTDGVVFLSSPVGWIGDFHPAPRRQFIFCLSGELEVEVSDGEKRRFGPGSVLFLEDTIGQGHASRVVGESRAYVVAVPITDP